MFSYGHWKRVILGVGGGQISLNRGIAGFTSCSGQNIFKICLQRTEEGVFETAIRGRALNGGMTCGMPLIAENNDFSEEQILTDHNIGRPAGN
jgi:hypothetical protein